MSLPYGAHFEQPSASPNKPHISSFAIARSAGDDELFEVWNGPTAAARVFRINEDGQVQVQDGAVGAPALAPEDDKDTGIYFVSGTPEVAVAIAGVKVLSVVAAGVAVDGTCTVDGDVVIDREVGVIRLNTADTADTGRLVLSGGGSGGTGTGRGAVVEVYGTDHATEPGNVVLRPGADGRIVADGQIVIDETQGFITLNTADGSDNGSLSISAGGPELVGGARGGRIQMYGNEHASQPGNVRITPGNDADLHVGASGVGIGFYGATPVAKQTGVAVSAAEIHAALVNLGLITA